MKMIIGGDHRTFICVVKAYIAISMLMDIVFYY
jgi:hypothetical protein